MDIDPVLSDTFQSETELKIEFLVDELDELMKKLNIIPECSVPSDVFADELDQQQSEKLFGYLEGSELIQSLDIPHEINMTIAMFAVGNVEKKTKSTMTKGLFWQTLITNTAIFMTRIFMRTAWMI